MARQKVLHQRDAGWRKLTIDVALKIGFGDRSLALAAPGYSPAFDLPRSAGCAGACAAA
jgi:hypothetical protein